MYKSKTFPKNGVVVLITLVYKSEDRNTVGNYRGIIIQLVISKLYSIALMTRMK